jgi:hypothetical protein
VFAGYVWLHYDALLWGLLQELLLTGEVLRVDGGWTAYHLFYPFETAF